MIPAARKSLIAGVTCLIVGTIIVAYGAELYISIENAAGATADSGLAVVSLIINITRSALPPLGGALVAAAVVIQAVAALVTDGRGGTEPEDRGGPGV